MPGAEASSAGSDWLTKPRLFTGQQESAFESFAVPCGQVAVASVGDAQKPRPNEDSAAVIPVNDTHLVLAVADGVGGLAGARQASNLTVRTLRKTLEQATGVSGASLRGLILDGIEAANQAVMDSGNSGASTLALAEIGPDYVRTYHVGDSILLVCGQRGAVKLQTTPHSPVGFAMEAGLIDEHEALHHEELNIIFNVIGSADMRIEIGSEQRLATRDTLLVASDGLADNLMVQEIVDAIRKGPLDTAIRSVTELALGRMATLQPGKPSKPDDCTAVLFRRPTPRRRR